MSAAACVINLTLSGILIKMPEHIDKVIAVDIIPYLLAFIAKNSIRLTGDRTLDKIS